MYGQLQKWAKSFFILNLSLCFFMPFIDFQRPSKRNKWRYNQKSLPIVWHRKTLHNTLQTVYKLG